MTSSAFTDYYSHVYDALIPGSFGTLAEQMLTAIIKNKKDFRGFYEAFRSQFMCVVSKACLIIFPQLPPLFPPGSPVARVLNFQLTSRTVTPTMILLRHTLTNFVLK